MPSALAESPPTQAPVPDTGAGLLATRSGQMTLPELIARAQELQAAGQPDSAALLYETWIAHTDSPMRPAPGSGVASMRVPRSGK